MILHTCPKCNAPCLYSAMIGQDVNCRSCGTQFVLNRFTRTEKDGATRFLENARLKAQSVRSSRKLIYSSGIVVAIALVWLMVSIFGLIPDEYRLLNRRFASISDEPHLGEAVGLVAVGHKDPLKGFSFDELYTAVAITNDGYLLTSKEVANPEPPRDILVFLGQRRLDAQVIGTDKIADFALIKVDGELNRRFRIAHPGAVHHLNVPVAALGHQPLEKEIRSPVKWPLAITRGTISRIFSDDMGTEWIEHSAPIGEQSRGGPVLLEDAIIGLNSTSRAGISRAVSIGPFRDSIQRMIQQSQREARTK